MNCTRESLLLYAVTDRHWLGDRTLAGQVNEAIDGGATFIQLREKDLDEESFEQEAREIGQLCRERGIPFVLDDNVMLVLKTGADGVHVGQKDMEAGNVRALIGENRILGVSAQTVEQAIAAEQAGADYLGVGAVFPTGSKDDADSVSYETLKEIAGAVSIPVIAIGGITKDNVTSLGGSGIAGVAVISAIFAKKDIRAAAAELREAVERIV